MSTAMQHEDDEVGLNEPVQMDSIENQQTNDVLPAGRKVHMRIVSAKIRVNYDDKEDKEKGNVKRLAVQYAVGPDGYPDGNEYEGKLANRRLFIDYVIAFTSGDGVRESDWWKNQARGPVKELFSALGIALNPPPPINQEFLEDLADREIFVDVLVKPRQRKTDRVNDKGKPVYENTGEDENDVKNHRAVGEHEA